jgi:hypothetical protein
MQEQIVDAPLPQLHGEEYLPDEQPIPPGIRGWRSRLFRVPNLPNPRRKRDVFKWWEMRRPAYNAIVGGIGFLSYVAFLAFGHLVSATATEFALSWENLIDIPAEIVIVMNICYAAGGAIEILLHLFGVRNRRIGPLLLKLGLAFSVFVVIVPTLIAFVMLLNRKD